MDAANGRKHFSFAVARAALEQGFAPDIISSDINVYAMYIEPIVSLLHVLSKYMNLGMSLMEVLRCATTTPARILGMDGKIGTLRPGAYADVAILEQTEKKVVFKETNNEGCETMTGRIYLVPHLTLIDGLPAFRSPYLDEIL